MELRYDEQNAITVPGATGLHIATVTGKGMFKYGLVKHNAVLGIYYCDGGSWPREIVTEVLTEKEEAV